MFFSETQCSATWGLINYKTILT